jgi:hypothetical protein
MTIKKLMLIIVMILSFAALNACESEGPAEKAGEKIDEAVEETAEKAEEAGEAIEEKAEEAKKEVKEATE